MAVIARGQITVCTVENGAAGPIGPAVVYRGDFSASSVYYNNSARRDVVRRSGTFYIYKGANGSSGAWNASLWESFGAQFDSVATTLLLAENANIGGFIFHGGKLISQTGTINGVESSDYTNASFVPHITLDGTNGTSIIQNGEFYGGVRTMFYDVNAQNCTALGNGYFKVSEKLNLFCGGGYSLPMNIVLPSSTSFIGKRVNIHNAVYALTKSGLMFENSTIVRVENNGWIYYQPFIGAQTDVSMNSYINSTQSIEYLAGTLTFLCVPAGGNNVSWICLNYPSSVSGGSSGGNGGSSSSGDVTASGTLSAEYLLLGAGSKSVKASSVKVQTALSNSNYFLPTGAAVKKYVDNSITTAVNGISIPESVTLPDLAEWYNIRTQKDENRKLYTYFENPTSVLYSNSSKYRLALLKYRKRHYNGRGWAMPMFMYELYNQGLAQRMPPCAIAEIDSWWPVTSNKTQWFQRSNHSLVSVISLTENAISGKCFWRNVTNKKMKVGVALYKKMAVGRIGWQRISNIAYIELYKTNTTLEYHIKVVE